MRSSKTDAPRPVGRPRKVATSTAEGHLASGFIPEGSPPKPKGKPAKKKKIDLYRYEKDARAAGYEHIAGVDEAGRGPLAGPVVAACVILPPKFKAGEINDSKQMTEAKREIAYERICREAIAVGVGVVHHEKIDEINILQATYVAMRLAISTLEPDIRPCIVLVDGNPVPGLPCDNVKSIVDGDTFSVSIAAASIIAKVTRDRFMLHMDRHYPQYGFAKHKGYSAPVHLAAIREHGPCPIHRRSFQRIAVFYNQTTLDL